MPASPVVPKRGNLPTWLTRRGKRSEFLRHKKIPFPLLPLLLLLLHYNGRRAVVRIGSMLTDKRDRNLEMTTSTKAFFNWKILMRENCQRTIRIDSKKIIH